MKIIGTTDLTAEASRVTGASRLTGLAPTLGLLVAVQCLTLAAMWWLLGAQQGVVFVGALVVGASSTVALFVWGVRRKIHDPLDRLLAAMARLRDIESGVFDSDAASRDARASTPDALPARLAHVFVGHEAAVDHLVVERTRRAQAQAELEVARAESEANRVELAEVQQRIDALAQPSGELAEARRRAFLMTERVERLVDAWSVAHRERSKMSGDVADVGGELASDIAKDLRGPVEAILGFTELTLKTQRALNVRGRANLERTLRAAHEIRAFLDDLDAVAEVGWTRKKAPAADANTQANGERPKGMRDVTRHEIAPSLVTEEFDVGKLIGECIVEVEPLTTGKSIEYDVQVAETLGRVRQDRAKVLRIVSSLLAHAVRFSTTGTIRVGAESEPGAMRIFVVGTGHAVSSAMRDRCFEPFGPVDPAGLSAGGSLGGTGLSLYVARSVARQLQGEAFADFEDGDEPRATIGVVVPLLAVLQPASKSLAKASSAAIRRGVGKRAGA